MRDSAIEEVAKSLSFLLRELHEFPSSFLGRSVDTSVSDAPQDATDGPFIQALLLEMELTQLHSHVIY